MFDIKKATEIDPWIYPELETYKIEVVSFEIDIVSGEFTYSYKTAGKNLSPEMKKAINLVNIGQQIIFKVYVRGIDGTVRILEPLSIKVSTRTEYIPCPPPNALKFILFFETSKFELSSEAIEELNKAVKILKSEPDKKVRITGFTDIKGDVEKNKNLSIQRAEAAADFIISNGISKERVSFSGKGAQTSAEAVKTERRVEIELFKD